MDELFWIGQVVWLCVLACGAYVSFCFADLADAESARMASKAPAKPKTSTKHPVAGAMGLKLSRE